MKAVRMTAAGSPLELQEVPIPEPGRGEVLIRVKAAGICHSDAHYRAGRSRVEPLPLTLGHEISGIVETCGPGAERWADKAVIVPAVMPCGACDVCNRGFGNICAAQKMPGNDIQGGFASHIVAPAYGLCPVDEAKLAAVGMELADVSVGADALTTPYQAAVQAGVGDGDLAIVIGAGGVGGYAVQVANAMGAAVVAIDVSQAKLDAVAGYGAALTLNAREMDGRALKKAISGFAAERGLRSTEWTIFECSGTGAGQLR